MQMRSRLIEGEFAVTDIVREVANLYLTHPAGDTGGQRALDGEFRGWMWMEQVQPGLLGSACDLTAIRDTTIDRTIDRSIMLALLLRGGNGQFRTETGIVPPAENGCMQILGFGHAQRCSRTLRAGEQGVRVGLTISPHLAEQFAIAMQGADLDLLDMLTSGGLHTLTLPRSELLIQLSAGLIDMPYRGPLGMLFRESAITQILFHSLQLLRQDQALLRGLGRRHHDAVLHARTLLDADLTNPPGTLELARRVGLNRNALQAGFKAMFGATIFGYVRDQRLAIARILIEEHGLGAAEAGYRVGFASPSAFAAAFRRRFGYPPTGTAGNSADLTTRH
ncbi:helix-turn-helix domain-containing protein [Niveispirillum irakense]|uniref:helix-turn-helix domain-containing protein n=1 Tax=Niveispirillum irakense TaxID=34011 RepID=UPI0004242F45|nr:AraC family transcriptional regulator [Niveispirillum irakense]